MMTKRGFTLVEVLVALVILAGTVIVLSQSWSSSLSAVKKSRLHHTISLLLQRRMVEWEVETKDKKMEEVKESDAGDFGSEFPDFTWEVKTQPLKLPALNFGENEKGGQNEIAHMMQKALEGYFEKAVREVSVTIIYRKGEKSQKFTANTYFIDYTKDLGSGGL
jgi:general secretion pathway protein I